MTFSKLISSLEESATLGIAKKVRELKGQGRNVIGLTLGEPDADTPAHIRDAAKKALDDGLTHYPPVAGIPELREAIAAKLRKENHLPYKAANVLVSTGAKQSLYNVVLAVMNPGDEAILLAPYWVSYDAMVHLAQGKSVILQSSIDTEYKVSAAQIEAAITPKTKLLFLNSPSNPSGSMYSRDELAAIVKVIERHPHVYVISDEIYEHMAYNLEHVSLGTWESIFDRVITVNGFSKGFAMTGWRLGYIAAPLEIVDLCERLQGQSTSGCTAFAQMGGVAALTESLAPTYAMKDEFLRRRDMLFDALREIEGLEVILPDGAFYFYPDLKNFIGKSTPDGKPIADIEALCLYLLDAEGLALVPGSAFGTDTHVRISYAYATDVLKDGVARMARALSALK
jgi:aspartate aminotransferase